MLLNATSLVHAMLVLLAPALAKLCDDGIVAELRTHLGSAKVVHEILEMPSPFQAPFATEHIRPLAVVTPSSSEEVALILGLADECGIPVAVRSNHGHSYIGQSTIENGIVLLMASFQHVGIGQQTGGEWIVSVGGGVNLGHLYDTLSENSPPLIVPAGSCGSVGLSGLIQGGGYGFLSVDHGFTSDRVIAADVVVWQPTPGAAPTSGGYVSVHANESNEHSQLLFALRGGLGGNYGVVTNWQLRATAKPSRVNSVSAKFQASASGLMIDVMKWLRRNDANGTAPLWAQFFFGKNSREVGLRVMCHCWDSCDRCRDPLAELNSMLSGSTSMHSISSTDFNPHDGMETWDVHAPSIRVFSMYFDDDTLLTKEGIAALFTAMQSKWKDISHFWMQLDFHAGAMTRSHDTAFGHRKPGWFNQVWTGGKGNDPILLSRHAWTTLLPFARILDGGAPAGYGNYIDADKRQSPRGYFASGADYARVQEVKCTYNPHEVFKNPSLAHVEVPVPATCMHARVDGATNVLLP